MGSPGVAAVRTARETFAALVSAYARHDPVRSVMIVGNAPLPVNAGRAALIDGSDLVVRMTTFALDAPGGPPCLGRRADVVMVHRGITPGPGTFADHHSRLYLMAEQGRLHWEREDRPDWYPVQAVSLPNADFTVPLNRLLGITPDEVAWPTAGTLACYMFGELFPGAAVRFTGTTILDAPGQTSFAHAHGPAVPVTSEHRLAQEAVLLRAWVREGRLEVLS